MMNISNTYIFRTWFLSISGLPSAARTPCVFGPACLGPRSLDVSTTVLVMPWHALDRKIVSPYFLQWFVSLCREKSASRPKHNPTPGPGQYTLPRKKIRGGRVSESNLPDEFDLAAQEAAQKPGPGQYDLRQVHLETPLTF